MENHQEKVGGEIIVVADEATVCVCVCVCVCVVPLDDLPLDRSRQGEQR